MPARLLAALLLTAGAADLPAADASCDAIEGRVVRWIVPNGVGGGYDAEARSIQPFLQQQLGARIRIENRPEGGGVVGARAIRDAAPDGRTIGIVNASGLLAARLADPAVPDPASDFTVLARLARNETILLTGATSGIRDLDALLRVAASRPILIGVRDAGSASVFVVPIVFDLLGVRYSLVTGYVGNNARVLAAMRGEVDVLVQSLDSTRRYVDSGELRLLLALGDTDVPSMRAVPLLGGTNGVASRRAAATGRSPERAIADARALSAVLDAGRLLVAPRNLPEATRRCLESGIATVLASDDLKSASGRAGLTFEPLVGTAAEYPVRNARSALVRFAPAVGRAMEQARR